MNYKHIYGLCIAAVAVLVVGHTLSVQQVRRDSAFDDRTSKSIESLSRAAETTYAEDAELPESQADISVSQEVRNQLNEANIKYEKTADDAYEICADFRRESDKQNSGNSPLAGALFSNNTYYSNSDVNPYQHKSGRECFEYQVTSDFNFGNLFNTPTSPEDGESDIELDDFEAFQIQ